MTTGQPDTTHLNHDFFELSMKFDLSDIEFSKNDLKRRLKLPNQLTRELAEMVGIIIGDGHIAIRHGFLKTGQRYVRYNVNISGNSNESEYLEHITNLFYSIFNLRLVCKRDPRSKATILRIHSRGLVQFLNKLCEIPLGRKTDVTFVPNIVKSSDKETKYAFLRGLADTDFSVTFRNRPNKGHIYPVIKAGFKSKHLVEDLEKLFQNLGFKYCVCYNQKRVDNRFGTTTINCIYLNGTDNFEKWNSRIGFSNHKFLRKVEKWQRDGICPPGY
jgi:intein/homing endonuclease